MNPSRRFIRFASVCCFITVITTLGIHAWFPDAPPDFDLRILLFKNKIYLLNRWWVIVHCLLVIASMWGFALIIIKRSPGFVPLGFLFFVVFAIAEITRQMYVLFYMNGMREQYYLATDPAVKEVLKNYLNNAGLLASPLFGVFIMAFGLGNLCYGLSIFHAKGFSRVLSILLIIWSAGSFVALGNSFWRLAALDSFMEKYNFTYTPFMRALIAIWLWRKSSELK